MFVSNVFWHMPEIVFDNGFGSYFSIVLGYSLLYVVCYVVCILLQIRDVLLSYVYRFVFVCCDCVHLDLYIVVNVEGNEVICYAEIYNKI